MLCIVHVQDTHDIHVIYTDGSMGTMPLRYAGIPTDIFVYPSHVPLDNAGKLCYYNVSTHMD